MSVHNTDLSCPFGRDIVEYIGRGLQPATVIGCKTVCTLWLKAMDELCKNQEIIRDWFTREKIPKIFGPSRDLYRDFTVLYPITISERRLKSSIGEIIGDVPDIGENYFNLLKLEDPYGEGTIGDNFRFIVLPSEIEILCNGKTLLKLDDQGNILVGVSKTSDEQKRNMLFSLRNFKVLCSQRKTDKPIFQKYCNEDVINQCGLRLKTNAVYLIRKCIAEKTRGMTYDCQREYIKNPKSKATGSIEFEVAPLLVRVLMDAVFIEETGTCPDVTGTYARCADTVQYVGQSYPSGVGDYNSEAGMDVSCYCGDFHSIGVAPSIRVDILQEVEFESI